MDLDLVDSFLIFCRKYGVFGRIEAAASAFYILDHSLGWVKLSYSDLHSVDSDLFPALEPVQINLF